MTTKQRIEMILRDHPEARNSDLELYILYLQKFCEDLKEISVIRKVLEKAGTNIAGLTRVRAYFQNKEKKYLSNKQVKKFREERESEMTQEYSPINNGRRY